MKVWPHTFAPILATMMVLWPIMGFMGAQGYTGSVAVGALLALPFLRLKRLPALAWAVMAFLVWIMVLTVIHPSTEPLIEGSLLSGDFSVNLPGLRFTLLSLAAMTVIHACLQITPGGGHQSLIVSRWSAGFHAALVACIALFMQQIIAAIAATGQSDPASMMQNLLRNANVFTLLLPFLLLSIQDSKMGLSANMWAGGLIGLSVFAFVLTGTQTALLAVIVMLLFMGVARLWPQQGLPVLCRGLASFVLLAPLILPYAVKTYLQTGWVLAPSFYSRAKGWQMISEKIAESPITGHGIEASYSWAQTFSDRPEWLAEAEARFGADMGWAHYEILNSHPHNMPIQIWVETGAIGAVLTALALVLLGQHLRRIKHAALAQSAAGLLGICAVISSVNYNMWNDAYWASVTIATGLLILYRRQLCKNG